MLNVQYFTEALLCQVKRTAVFFPKTSFIHSPETHITENYMFWDFPFKKRNLTAFLLSGLQSQEVEETAWNLIEMHEFHMGCSESQNQSRELATCNLFLGCSTSVEVFSLWVFCLVSVSLQMHDGIFRSCLPLSTASHRRGCSVLLIWN